MSIETVTRPPEAFPIGLVLKPVAFGAIGAVVGGGLAFIFTTPMIEQNRITDIQANHAILKWASVGFWAGAGIGAIVELLDLLTK